MLVPSEVVKTDGFTHSIRLWRYLLARPRTTYNKVIYIHSKTNRLHHLKCAQPRVNIGNQVLDKHF